MSTKKMFHYKYYASAAALLLSTSLIGVNAYASAFDSQGTQALSILNDIDNSIPASTFALTKTLNQIFNPYDPLFPITTAQNADQLNTAVSTGNLSAQMTQTMINTQLQTLSTQISSAYNYLSKNGNDSLSAPLENATSDLTYNKPSYDTLYLPGISCNETTCAVKPDNATAQQNANSLSFDQFFTPSNYSSLQQSAAQNYIAYTLQTSQPLVDDSVANAAGSQGGGQNKSFFQTLNDYLKEHPDKANSFLVNSVLKNPQFQQYWLTLRTTAAKNSLVVSNFNFLSAERTPQKGLGTAYGLPNLTDASALQVENGLMNQTINNPTWYQQMRTAPLATLQRQQLLLTALLVRIQYQNQMLNERNLATLSILTDSMLQQSKQGLAQQENALKTAIFPQQNSPTTTPKQPQIPQQLQSH